ncbi:MAG: hypothetical protein A2W17_09670 [Planctomycetes bacterium RBG_16_41_13]|nr:MAG: hypothetical protein A2W17_09670 [Planctomycetes bacterium RBG_16_41_13]
MEYLVRKKEPLRRFVTEQGPVVEYTEQDVDDMGMGMDEKEFDNKRYGGHVCVGCAGCGYGSCSRL